MEESLFLGDFHIHSKNSDGKLSIREIVDLYGRQGFGAIAITDHLCEVNTFLGQSARYLQKTLLSHQFENYLYQISEQAQRAMKIYNMVVIPGVEFTKNSFSHKDSAHILALGIKKFIDPDLNIKDIIEKVHEQDALVVAAHPVATRKMEPQTYYLWNNRDELSDKIDAWEVASGAHLFQEVRESGLPMLANSDLHHPRQMSSWKTVLEGERTLKNILNSIKYQNLNFTYYESQILNESLLRESAVQTESASTPVLIPC